MTSHAAYYAFIVAEHERQLAARRVAPRYPRRTLITRISALIALRSQRPAARPA